MKPSLMISAAALALLVSPVAAQTTDRPATPPKATPPAASAPSMANGVKFVTKGQAAEEWRASKLIGLNVYNSAEEKIGQIDDLILGKDGKVEHAVIGVGGFLGLGAKDVAVELASLMVKRDANGSPTAHLNTTKDALKAAPEYVFYQASGQATRPSTAPRAPSPAPAR